MEQSWKPRCEVSGHCYYRCSAATGKTVFLYISSFQLSIFFFYLGIFGNFRIVSNVTHVDQF